MTDNMRVNNLVNIEIWFGELRMFSSWPQW